MCMKSVCVCFVVLVTLGASGQSFRFKDLTDYVDKHQDQYVQALRIWVSIESDSSDVTKRAELNRMMGVVEEKLQGMKGKVDVMDVGTQTLVDGSVVPLPKVVTAVFGDDENKHTVCVYGHVDVQPARREDGWATDPYNLTEINGNLYGRGASDNKAPVLAWIHAVEAYKALNMELPVNVKFLIEGMEETGSDGLGALVEAQREEFFSDVGSIIISDCSWKTSRPALTYGTRGNCYFSAQVEGPRQDLHSGMDGGAVIEPMTDLIAILNTLISASGQILIPGITDAVANFTEEERKIYEEVDFDLDTYKNTIGVDGLMYDNKVDLLAHLWRFPTVSIHGIEGAFSAPGTKTVIPAKVTAKFSIRQVPDMEPAVVEKQVTDHLHTVFQQRKSPNKLKVKMIIGAKPWLADPKHALYEAGKRAVKRVFSVEPELIREGGTIPIARTFQDVTKKDIIMLPIGGFDDGFHSQNEKISRYNYIEGTKLFIAYLHEVSHIQKN
ncbi:hypothetical protein QTP86_014140 [Hemibagrus guttatus]|nr:hypothetical protein QTP86_014140 [Hemibagrus guttatus]